MRRARGADWLPAQRLGRRAVRGGLVSAGGTWARFLVQLLTTIVAARLLGPAEFGIVTVLLVVVGGVAEVIRSGAAAIVITRGARLSPAEVSSLHWGSCLTGLVTGGVLALCGRPAVALLGDDRYGVFFPVLAICLPLAGIAAVPGALLARNLAFRALAAAEVGGVALGALVAVGGIAVGLGPVALVGQAVTLWAVIAVTLVAACPWRPSRPAPFRAVRHHVRAASEYAAVQLFGLTTGNVDRLVVGAASGAASAGLYAQASQLMLLPLQQVSAPLERIAVPLLGRAHADAERFAAGYRSVVSLLALVLWPAYTVLGVVATPLVLVLFGGPWRDAALPLRILVVAGVVHTLGYVSTWLFAVAGRSRAQLVWELVTRPLLVGGILIGARWGAVGVATAASAGAVALVLPRFLAARRGNPIGRGALLAPLARPALVAAAAGIGASASFLGASPIAALGLGCGGAGVAAAVTVVAVPWVRTDVLQLVRSLLAAARSRPGSPTG